MASAGSSCSVGGVEVAARDQQAAAHDVHADRGHVLRVERQRGARDFVDVVPLAALERDHRRGREQVAAVRAVEAEIACERRAFERQLPALLQPTRDEQDLRQVGVGPVDVVEVVDLPGDGERLLEQRDAFVELRERAECSAERVAGVAFGGAVTDRLRDLDRGA